MKIVREFRFELIKTQCRVPSPAPKNERLADLGTLSFDLCIVLSPHEKLTDLDTLSFQIILYPAWIPSSSHYVAMTVASCKSKTAAAALNFRLLQPKKKESQWQSYRVNGPLNDI